MDLLRAHADAVLLGVGTLKAEQRVGRPRPRGPVFRIVDPALLQLRAKLHRGPERNIFVSATGDIQFADYAAFDGEKVEPFVLTTPKGAEKLQPQLATHPHVKIISSGEGTAIDLAAAMRTFRQQYGLRYVVCEGGPTLYGGMIHAGLIDEKFLTIAPFDAGANVPAAQRAAGDPIRRPTAFGGEGFDKEHMARWQWLSCRRIENYQFHRFRRK